MAFKVITQEEADGMLDGTYTFEDVKERVEERILGSKEEKEEKSNEDKPKPKLTVEPVANEETGEIEGAKVTLEYDF